ncbi:MAG: alpha/beta fold hydrolase [Nitrososphaeraceae archaeon]
MTTTTSRSDQYSKSVFSLYADSFTDVFNAFTRALSSSAQFNIVLYKAFSQFYPMYLDIISEYNKSWKDLSELDKVLRSRFRNAFDEKFRDADFVNRLSDTITSYSELAKVTGLGQMYRDYSNGSSIWNNKFIEPIRDTLYRTPSEKICEIEKYSLFHYKRPSPTTSTISATEKVGISINQKAATTPVLIIYAFINRHYILDLLPEVSVVRSLLNQGLDIFAADWGTPSTYDKSLTISHFVNSYLDKSIDLIRKITKSDKVSLFGYCWGGDLALMYASIHPEKVKNLIIVATPGDFDLDNSLLAVWTKTMKEDLLLDTFGNLPGILLNAAFVLRNPIEYGHKYFHFFEQPRSLESVTQFFATETWLNDSPPIIGEIYREFVEHCYKENLLIKNKMRIREGHANNNFDTVVNLKNIDMPFLNIVAKRDDLVAPSSSKALNDALTESHDRSIIELNSGHVGLMIGKDAHKELWPKVGKWLNERS